MFSGSAFFVSIAVLAAVIIGTALVHKRKPRGRLLNLPGVGDGPRVTMITPGRTVAVMKLDRHGEVADKMAHSATVVGFATCGKAWVLKPNQSIPVKRAFRRLKVI